MFQFKLTKKFISAFLVAALWLPGILLAQDHYTEDLWEVTDSGVFNEEGEAVVVTPQTSSPEAPGSSQASPSSEDKAFERYKASLIDTYDDKKEVTETQLNGVKESLEEQKKRFETYTKQIETTEEQLVPLREQVSQLQGQIELVNRHIRITQQKITNVEVMIAEKKIQIKEALIDLQKTESELEVQKQMVLDYINLLYREESQFYDIHGEGASSIKLLLADNSISESLMGQEYLKIMEETGREVFYELNLKRQELAEKQKRIAQEQADLEFLYGQLNDERRTYEESRLAKKELLEKTEGEEEKYALLLEEALQQQLEASIAVQNLQDHLQTIESALSALSQNLKGVSGAQSRKDLKITPEMLELLGDEDEEVDESRPFIWPVPANKITAKFRDPTYPAKWGAHNAIDVRAKQYTPIVAPDDAYVFQAQDNGMGYSYIVLAHRNNLVTVYGHVSDIQVKEGDTVRQGEVIGLSGGSPGTMGAGLQTTGAHLHFEVYKDGVPVDPLNYLDLEGVDVEYLPPEHHGHEH